VAAAVGQQRRRTGEQEKEGREKGALHGSR
jgi:hypothetical protein